jgi:hypothetical protein
MSQSAYAGALVQARQRHHRCHASSRLKAPAVAGALVLLYRLYQQIRCHGVGKIALRLDCLLTHGLSACCPSSVLLLLS